MEGRPSTKEYAVDYLTQLKDLNEKIATDTEFLKGIGIDPELTKTGEQNKQAIQIVGARLKRHIEERNALYAKNNIVHTPYENKRDEDRRAA